MNADSYVAPSPRERDGLVTFGRPSVLYQSAGATVTTTHFEAGGYRYPVTALTDVERVEQGGLLHSRLYELWATFNSQRVRLFRCYDAREFGQVCRALTRAREYAGVA